ncbi:cysteine desulfurase [Rubrivivax sp. JA1024]|nr:cysteine desulfurase [Rubrivivax sp. JA1024]
MAHPGSLIRQAAERRPLGAAADKPQSPLRELFAPLDLLLTCGGDTRIDIDPATGCNAYGCSPSPAPEIPSFASCTASTISPRGYEAVKRARDALMSSAMLHGLVECFDARIEAMRDELKALLGVPQPGAEIVFTSSGTDAQLVALGLTRALLGDHLVTVVAGADQTGTGTAFTAHGQHFAARSACGVAATRGAPINGLGPVHSVKLRLRDVGGRLCSPSSVDAETLEMVESAVAQGARVMLEAMDCSKLGYAAPGDRCLDEIAARWPGRVQIVIDACQARLGSQRLASYLDRGFMVLLTGSKFFGGPAFSGAVLVPPQLVGPIGALPRLAPGLAAYLGRSDWPLRWQALRAQFPAQPNFGEWLRWEAALEEIRAYAAVPVRFRRDIIRKLGDGLAGLISASPSARLLPPQSRAANADEFALPTIFAFTLHRGGSTLSLAECRALHHALAHGTAGHAACLLGQPVGWGGRGDDKEAALRLCISAGHVVDSYADPAVPDRILTDAASALTTLETLLRQPSLFPDNNAAKERHVH